MSKDNPPARPAQEQFGRQAGFYAESDAHRAGESLDSVVEYASLGRYGTVVDLGTGAGFTAFALAPYATRVLASDIAPGMLAQVNRLATERGIHNVELLLGEAEALPFAVGSVDAVSCRQAAHHFHDLPRAVREVKRVLKSGAVFILSDSVAPEGDQEARWMNDVEVRRDATHQKGLRPSEWRNLLEGLGFGITHWSLAKVYLEFNDWVQRADTPQHLIKPLREDFLRAPAAVVATFGIQPDDGAINFHWDALVLRAVKR